MKLEATKIAVWTPYSNSLMNYRSFSSGDIAGGNVVKRPWEAAVINHAWCGSGWGGGGVVMALRTRGGVGWRGGLHEQQAM